MMIMAYCLLWLDGRVDFRPMIDNPDYIQETSSVTVDNLLQISNSCLILLTFCADKWPGLVGMRDVYCQLSDQILKQVLRKMYGTSTG
jgi:hypothetical protein